jgi:hypothetical protein
VHPPQKQLPPGEGAPHRPSQHVCTPHPLPLHTRSCQQYARRQAAHSGSPQHTARSRQRVAPVAMHTQPHAQSTAAVHTYTLRWWVQPGSRLHTHVTLGPPLPRAHLARHLRRLSAEPALEPGARRSLPCQWPAAPAGSRTQTTPKPTRSTHKLSSTGSTGRTHMHAPLHTHTKDLAPATDTQSQRQWYFQSNTGQTRHLTRAATATPRQSGGRSEAVRGAQLGSHAGHMDALGDPHVRQLSQGGYSYRKQVKGEAGQGHTATQAGQRGAHHLSTAGRSSGGHTTQQYASQV